MGAAGATTRTSRCSGSGAASCPARTRVPRTSPTSRQHSPGCSGCSRREDRKAGCCRKYCAESRPLRLLRHLRPPYLSPMPGSLHVVATPLGNLGDLSVRAMEVLRAVPGVAAEDTRRTRGLLSHLRASPRLLSYHAHSEEPRLETLLEILHDGRDVALVSDAGTPVVSDPGTDLVAAARASGVTVVPIPGPSAVATALSAAGLKGDRYLFLGFVPRKGSERARLLARAAAEEWSVVFFEAPPRLTD